MRGVPGVEAASLRVVRKLSVSTRGAIKLAHEFGETLVCVRHRVDAKGEFRYTTVELLVDKARIRPRVESTVLLRIGPTEHALQQVVRTAGANWDPARRLWRMPKRLAGILRLGSRIVQR